MTLLFVSWSHCISQKPYKSKDNLVASGQASNNSYPWEIIGTCPQSLITRKQNKGQDICQSVIDVISTS